ncbi:thiamine phosphate synthase [Emcibacter sp.]|uniref:thiamine phosphate synthase n=1 Tax=Emcibacter sp. TaxID=1979954 RepID=UPI002AA8EC68|nr:thiamine phosphate synthase [Emcibacter sp.]
MFYQRQTLAAIAAKLNQGNQSDWPLGPALYLTDATVHPAPERILEQLPPASVVVLRDYDHPGREALARHLAGLCRRKHLYFLVGADAALARKVGAVGVHLPEGLVRHLPRLRHKHQDFIFTTACHSARALHRAERLGADAVLLSPVFPTESHPESLTRPDLTLGPTRFRTLCRRTDLPVYALGGVTGQTAQRLRHAPLAGLASIRGYEEG